MKAPKTVNDDEFSSLFRTGTAAERDPQFSERVNRLLRHEERISTIRNAVRFCSVAMLVAGIFVLTQMYQTAFGHTANELTSAWSSTALPILVAFICIVFRCSPHL